ncbi:IS66 family transposase [Metallibacterium sp.]|jgi:transposase|uniref:IS66 family transposase n=1 Tax=Metallibacterium sp. TaxID=2940281 RepID=UPI002635ED7E|nr:IS66 family transposase [Metallibacterium sp.]
MDSAQLATITDAEVLRGIVANALEQIAERDQSIAQFTTEIARRDHTIAWKSAEIERLTAEIARLRRVQFAARSEKMDPDQRALFDETMAADLAAVETQLQALRAPDPASPAATPAQAQRPAPRRAPLPAELPRVETRHEPASCTCAQCGTALVLIGEHVSEKLDCKPLEFFVRREVYPQYACRACATVTAVPVAPAIIDRGIAAPGLLAQVAVSKYLDHLPLYRQEAIYARSGVTLGRTTLAEWIGAIGVALQPLVDALRRELLTRPVLHADETPVAQLDPGRGQTQRAYLFAYASAAGHDETEPPIILFDYCASRSGQHARRFLGDWRGRLMVDDFSGYKALFCTGITELGCWAHARRKYYDLHQASGSPVAQEALNWIAALYRVEAAAKDLAAEDRKAYRQEHAAPLLHAMRVWLDDLRPTVPGASGTARAIDYTLRRWSALTRYLEDGRDPIDNNRIENAIRPIALGRRNWLFAGSERAGQRAAAIMSLLATAKANGHDPHAWLTDVLTRLPTTRDRDIGTLLPTTWQPAT